MGRPLTGDAFERLLSALGPDRQVAAEEYERLRDRLIGLLRWWGAVHPEELADDSLDRVAHKLFSGAVVPQGSLGAYVRGVARLVFYEARREPQTHEATSALAAPEPEPDLEATSACLDTCLHALSPPDRATLLAYYGDGRASDVRRDLARRAGVSVVGLRVRMHRLRAQVESCVQGCLGRVRDSR